MMFLRRLNPTRTIVGRLFLWFWATFIVTALLAIWGSRLFFEDLQVVEIKPMELKNLQAVAQRLTRERFIRFPLEDALRRNSRGIRGRLIAVNVSTGTVISYNGPPLRENEKRDLIRLVNQQAPIGIKRGALKLIGPVFFEKQNQQYALFSAKLDMSEKQTPPVLLFLCIALITTVLLSWLFARSLTKPLLQIQSSAKRLAEGEWQTRVNIGSKRHDELGQLARDFNVMAAQLENMWGAQKRLLADVSHELRSPLTRLQMALGLAYQQNVDINTLERVEREAERMEALISQLLTLSRAEAGGANIKTCSLSQILDDVFKDANFEAATCSKQLQIETVPQKTVLADGIMLCRAVENVLRNAIRHSRLLTKVSFGEDEATWFIRIVDDGEGLSLDECKRIFSPFYRASLARERTSGGVGLGLSIAKAAVELHHGRIDAVPISGSGLQVTLIFPKELSSAP